MPLPRTFPDHDVSPVTRDVLLGERGPARCGSLDGMTNADRPEAAPVSRPAASAAVTPLGWRYLLNRVRAIVPVTSLDEAVRVAAVAAGAAADARRLAIDLRDDRVALTVVDRSTGSMTEGDLAVVRSVTSALHDAGFVPGPTGDSAAQLTEIAIDALDIPAVRPFWRAVLAYVDDPADSPVDGGLVDPTGLGPSLWFQQMDAPRPQRNRIHLDVDVPHDHVEERIAAAVAAGGTLLSDAHARAFWVLADAEGNEVCLCTWQDREPPGAPPGSVD